MGESRNGHINHFNGKWFFDYNVADTEGLTLLNGFFDGRQVFRKLSLPVIRVKYVKDEDLLHNPIFGNGCGPYNDQISWDPVNFGENLNPITGPYSLMKMEDCGKRYVCIRSKMINGVEFLELAVYARIGAYHIYQAWYLNDNGLILARVFSKGLSCNLDHWHHPYWRFHFDLDGDFVIPQTEQVHLFNGTSFVGIETQEREFKNADIGRAARYRVENFETNSKAWITPPMIDPTNGIVPPTSFSRWDVVTRKFRSNEDRSWPHKPEEEIFFPIHETCDKSDIIFWSICHLFHQEHEGSDHWHEVGPDIQFEIPRLPDVKTEQFRKVTVAGTIHIKNFKAWPFKDDWGHHNFTETRNVNPNNRNAEIVVDRSTGDVRSILTIRMKWNKDSSIGLKAKSVIYDESDEVDKEETNFNVLVNESVESVLKLEDYHWGDPDTSDTELKVTNAQA